MARPRQVRTFRAGNDNPLVRRKRGGNYSLCLLCTPTHNSNCLPTQTGACSRQIVSSVCLVHRAYTLVRCPGTTLQLVWSYSGTKPSCFGHTRVFQTWLLWSYSGTKPGCFGHTRVPKPSCVGHTRVPNPVILVILGYVPGYHTRIYTRVSYSGIYPGIFRVYTLLNTPLKGLPKKGSAALEGSRDLFNEAWNVMQQNLEGRERCAPRRLLSIKRHLNSVGETKQNRQTNTTKLNKKPKQ